MSVITEEQWPSSWPRQPALAQFQGIGQARSPEQSSDQLHWQDDEGHRGVFQLILFQAYL